MSSVWFGNFCNILKKAIYEKLNSLISYENNGRMNFSSTQARAEILFDLESTCHEEL